MNIFSGIILPVLVFIGLGVLMGVMLAVASKAFAVKTDPREAEIASLLPGANCGGCGFAGCAAFAAAVVKGDAAPSKCAATDNEVVDKICGIMGVETAHAVRMRAQVMCSGTSENAQKKYLYSGIPDCISAATLGGGDKLCPNGCIGLGTCVRSCAFGAITVIDGVAVVDYAKCRGCGVCVVSCPKNLIELIPFDSKHRVGCKSVELGKATRSFCSVGCIGCKLCEKSCDADAISVNDNLAYIVYDKCVDCGACVAKCPRGIIKSPEFNIIKKD